MFSKDMPRLLEDRKISAAQLVESLENFQKEYFELYPHEVPVLDYSPTAFEFFKDYVSQNRPVIIKNAVVHFAAYRDWTNEYLRSKLKNKKITVAVTPNGYADAIYNNKFMLAEERLMTIDDFLKTIENPQRAVYYIQKQDNNLPQEFKCLMPDLHHRHIPWATEAFGEEPDAINFWMGDSRAVSSMHKDHYENIYCVIKGKKDFILHAPVDAPWIPSETYRTGVFHGVSNVGEPRIRCEAEKDELRMIHWIAVDPLDENQTEYPLYRKARKIHCTVEAGDVLYLPSLWFHHVRQSQGCIAVNYWYDMDFNNNYCHFKFLEDLGRLIHIRNDE